MENMQSLDQMIHAFTTINRSSDDVHWFGSPDFNTFFHVSYAYEKIWGRSVIELCKDPEAWITYFFPNDAKHYHPLKEMAKRVLDQGPDARYYELYRIVLPSNEIRWILDKGHPVFNEKGDCIAVTGAASDVTNQKKVEQLQHDSKYIRLVKNILPEFIAQAFTSQKNIKLSLKKMQSVILTKYELECILDILKGKTAKEIAKTCKTSPRTIEHRIERIKEKLHVSTRSQLIEEILSSELIHL